MKTTDSVQTLSTLDSIRTEELDARAETSIVLRDYAGAVDLLREIIKRDSTNGKAFSELGRCYGRLKKTEAAKKMHLHAFELDYKKTAQYCYIATYYYQDEKFDSCRLYLDKALKIDPQDRAVLLLDRLYFPRKPKKNI